MQSLKFLNSKEKKEIQKSLEESYGYTEKINDNILLSTKEMKLYFLSDSEVIRTQQAEELRIDKAGLYVGKIERAGILLNIEGSQLFGPHAKKHIIEIDDEHLEHWVKGEDFELSEREKEQANGEGGVFILKLGNDFLGGCIVKNGNVQNCISKTRKVKNLNR